MAQHLNYPGVYIQEIPSFGNTIVPASTGIAAFVGRTPKGPLDTPVRVASFGEFQASFGDVTLNFPVTYAVQQFFLNGGAAAVIARLFEPDAADPVNGTYLSEQTLLGSDQDQTGMFLLNKVAPGEFDLLVIPPDGRLLPSTPEQYKELSTAVRQAAARFCVDRRAIFLVDPPARWSGTIANAHPTDLGIADDCTRNCAVYFPNLLVEDPSSGGSVLPFPPSGAVAGVIAAADAEGGVWKAPAGINASLGGIEGLSIRLTDEQNSVLNPLGINCLRVFPQFGAVVWGARTLAGADAQADDYKYLSVRRLTLFLENSIQHGMQWAVFQPNNETLWSSLRLEVDTFLKGLSQQGAFYDYDVRCDSSTTTPQDVANGKVNLQVAFAPLKPGEFLVLQFQQMARSAA